MVKIKTMSAQAAQIGWLLRFKLAKLAGTSVAIGTAWGINEQAGAGLLALSLLLYGFRSGKP